MNSSLSPIEQLASRLNEALQAGVAVSEDESLYLRLGDGSGVVVSPSPDGADAVFHTALAMLGSADDGALMACALRFNLHQEMTRGGAVGLDPDAQLLVFSWRLPVASLDEADMLVECLEQFCATAQELAHGLEEARSGFSEYGPPSDEVGNAAPPQYLAAVEIRG